MGLMTRLRNGNAKTESVDGEVIRMTEVRKVYDTGRVQVEALRGIDLTVRTGEFAAVVGPSGSGKSTLMNLIGLLDTPTSGDYTLRGRAVARLGRDDLADVSSRGNHLTPVGVSASDFGSTSEYPSRGTSGEVDGYVRRLIGGGEVRYDAAGRHVADGDHRNVDAAHAGAAVEPPIPGRDDHPVRPRGRSRVPEAMR